MHHHPTLLQPPSAMYMYLSLLLLVVVLQTVRTPITSALPPLNSPTTYNCNSCGASPFFCTMSYAAVLQTYSTDSVWPRNIFNLECATSTASYYLQDSSVGSKQFKSPTASSAASLQEQCSSNILLPGAVLSYCRIQTFSHPQTISG